MSSPTKAREGDEDPRPPSTMSEQGVALYEDSEETFGEINFLEHFDSCIDKFILSRPRYTEVVPFSTIWMNHMNMSKIQRVTYDEEVHSLYLEQNKIKKIENLESFPKLRFISLAGNRIQKVENLKALTHLNVLDLSHNQIEVLDTEELPQSLRVLDLRGNKCTQQDGYRELLMGALPYLVQLDGQLIRGNVGKTKKGGGSSSSRNEDDDLLFPKPSIPFTVDKDFIVDLQQELDRHSQQRRKEALEEHQARLEELQERRDLLLSPGWDGATSTAALEPQQSQPHPPLPGSSESQ